MNSLIKSSNIFWLEKSLQRRDVCVFAVLFKQPNQNQGCAMSKVMCRCVHVGRREEEERKNRKQSENPPPLTPLDAAWRMPA